MMTGLDAGRNIWNRRTDALVSVLVCVCKSHKWVRVSNRVCVCLRVREWNNYKRTDQGHDIGFWLGPIKHFPTPSSPWPIFSFIRVIMLAHWTIIWLREGFFYLKFFLPRPKNENCWFFFIHLLILHVLLYSLGHRCRRNNRQRSVSLSFITFILDFYAPAAV